MMMSKSMSDLADYLYSGRRSEEGRHESGHTTTRTGIAAGDSSGGTVMVIMSDDVTQPEDGIGRGTAVEIPTAVSVKAGDRVIVTLVGGTLKSPHVSGVIGRGDELASGIQDAIDIAEAAILSVDVEYAQAQSQTVPPAGGWATEAPAWQEGWYIWQRTKTVASTGESYSDPVCISGRDGIDGSAGSSVSVSKIEYGTSASAGTQPASWSQAAPASIAKGSWLWVRTAYSDGSSAMTKSYAGTDGQDGTSVALQSVTKVGHTTTVVLADGSGTQTLTIVDGEDGEDGIPGATGYVHTAWATSADGSAGFSTTVSAGKTYLGVYCDHTAADSTDPADYSWSLIKGSTGATGPQGDKGDDGTGISSVTVSYAVSANGTTAPASGWQQSVPSTTPGQYLWTRTVTDYTDAAMQDTVAYSVSRHGATGAAGAAGTSVTVSSIQYQAGSSATSAPTGTWSNTVVSAPEGQYLWTKTTFSNGSVAYGVAKQGAKGATGATGAQGATGPQGPTGTGVSAIVEQYYLSTSATSQTGGSWQTSQPQWQEGRHIWTRSKVTWTDGTTTHTTPVLAKAVNGANSSASAAQQAASQAQADVDASRSWYAECSTAANVAAKAATITPATDAFALAPGRTVFVRFSATNTASVASLTLNVNGTGVKPVKTLYNQSLANLYHASHLQAGVTYQCTYDGSVWIVSQNVNTNYFDRIQHNNSIKAAAAITASRIICGTSAGYRNIAAGAALDTSYPLLYATAAIAAGATGTATFEAYPNVKATYNGTVQSGAQGRMLWLKGTLSGSTLTIAQTNWLTTVVPASEDGMAYIALGLMASNTQIYFKPSGDLYGFADGRFQRLDKAALAIADAARSVADATAQHFWSDSEGAHVTQAAQAEWEASHSGPNSLWNSLGMLFRDGLSNLLGILSGTTPGQRGIAVYDGEGNDASNIVASFTGAGAQVGREGSSNIRISGDGIDLTGEGGALAGRIGTGDVGTIAASAQRSGSIYYGQPVTFHLAPMPIGTPPEIAVTFKSGWGASAHPDVTEIKNHILPIPGAWHRHQFWDLTVAASGDGFDVTLASLDDYDPALGRSYQITVYWHREGAMPHAFFGTAGEMGPYAFAAGMDNSATGQGSAALGRGLVASRESQAVFGRYNEDSPAALLIVGNGSGDDDRSNALSVDVEGKTHLKVAYDSYIGTAMALHVAQAVAAAGTATGWAYLDGGPGSANYCRWRHRLGTVFVQAYYESTAGIQAYAARRCGTIPAPYRPDHEVDAGGYLGSGSDHAAAIWVAADGGVHLACANGVSSGSFYGSISYPRQD